MRFALALLFVLSLCLPASAECGRVGRVLKAPANLAQKLREAKPARRLGARILDVLTPRR